MAAKNGKGYRSFQRICDPILDALECSGRMSSKVNSNADSEVNPGARIFHTLLDFTLTTLGLILIVGVGYYANYTTVPSTIRE